IQPPHKHTLFPYTTLFRSEGEIAIDTAKKSLQKGFEHAYTEYAKGWRDWIATLKAVDPKYRDQFQIAAMVMKAHEDKTYRGAGRSEEHTSELQSHLNLVCR